MQKLNLPEFRFRIKEQNRQVLIFDEFRRKWMVLSPEEWVRQNFLKYLTEMKGFPKTLLAVEKKVDINGLPQRFDLLVYNRNGLPLLVAEFKSPAVNIDQQTFDQAVRYNSRLMAPYVLVSNGLSHFISKIDFASGTSGFLKEIPSFREL